MTNSPHSSLLTSMLSSWLTQLGDWNPQFLREIKGRFTFRNLLTTAVLSLLGQAFIFLYVARNTEFAKYEVGQYGAEDITALCYQVQWFDVFQLLTRYGLLLLLTIGCYLIAEDMAGESRRGTLTFIRLSPQSGTSILLGKLLGLPILLYVAIALTLPLHLWAAFHAGLSVLIIGIIYLLAGISCAFAFTATLCYTLTSKGKTQVWLAVFLAGGLSVLLSAIWNSWANDYRNVMIRSAEIVFVDAWVWVGMLFIIFIFGAVGLWGESISRFRQPSKQ